MRAKESSTYPAVWRILIRQFNQEHHYLPQTGGSPHAVFPPYSYCQNVHILILRLVRMPLAVAPGRTLSVTAFNLPRLRSFIYDSLHVMPWNSNES